MYIQSICITFSTLGCLSSQHWAWVIKLYKIFLWYKYFILVHSIYCNFLYMYMYISDWILKCGDEFSLRRRRSERWSWCYQVCNNINKCYIICFTGIIPNWLLYSCPFLYITYMYSLVMSLSNCILSCFWQKID